MVQTRRFRNKSRIVDIADMLSLGELDQPLYPHKPTSGVNNKKWRTQLLGFIFSQISSFEKVDTSFSKMDLLSGIDEEASRLGFVARILNVVYELDPQTLDYKSDLNSPTIRRILARIGLFANFGFDQDLIASTDISKLIPPGIQDSIVRGLICHSNKVCKPKKPACNQCVIRRFCQMYRDEQVKAAEKSDRPTVVDLFCGAGGLSNGFFRAGFRTILAIDQNPKVIRTFKLNHPEVPESHVLCEDLRDFNRDAQRIETILKGQSVDVLVGGPPCQGFSRIGWRSRGSGKRFEATEDDRNHLYSELISLLKHIKPKVVLMENVPGIGEVRFPDGSSFQEVTERAMRELGYQPSTWTINAASFGVPQVRVRRVIVGTSLSKTPISPPVPKYYAKQYQRRGNSLDQELPGDLEKPISVMEAIGDLPMLEVDDGLWVAKASNVSNSKSRYFERYALKHPAGLIFSHKTRFQNTADLERYGSLNPGDTYMDLLQRRPDLENYRTDGFEDKYYRLHPDRPSRTIVAHLRKDGNSFVHPEQVRSISVREAARLQSFDDEYIFTGSRGDQFEQIGNAVPPLMAEAMAKAILEHIRQHSRTGKVKKKSRQKNL